MPQVSGTKTYNTFVAGMITEASPLTFPENASLDELNFQLNRNGSRQRRMGMDYEVGFARINTGTMPSTFDEYAISTFRWDSPSNSGDISIGIVQVRNSLWFMDLNSSAPSANLLNNGNAYTISAAEGKEEFQYASVNGVLVVVCPEFDPIYLEYDEDTDTISGTTITIQIRDTFGVDDDLEVDEHPKTLTNRHRYNLLNQGWLQKHIDTFYSRKKEYPNNVEIWHAALNVNLIFSPVLFDSLNLGNTPAPRGHFIIDAYDRSGSRIAQLGKNLPEDKDLGKVSTVASYASRVFYAGVISNRVGGDKLSPRYNGIIFFSPVVDNNNKLGQCYQEADPTAEDISDLVDTDGGFVIIPEASRIYRLVPASNELVVFADNGIWAIRGASKGFVATEYEVVKLSNEGVEGPRTIVRAENKIYYWSRGGIYVLEEEAISGEMRPQNISETTIQTYYSEIKNVAKLYARGNYDPISKKVSWLYNDTAGYTGTSFKYSYNKELYFDTVLGAFYPYEYYSDGTDAPIISGYLTTPNFLLSEMDSTVLVGNNTVLVDSDTVIVTNTETIEGSSTTRYAAFEYDQDEDTYYLTLAYRRNASFLDWEEYDSIGQDYSSYLITGYELAGDIMRYKQVPYIFFYFERTEDGFDSNINLENQSSCWVQSRWDWTNSANSGKWGSPFQAYRFKRNYIPDGQSDTFDYGYEVIVTKSKLRGRGRALSLKIYSEAGKDMKLLGWAMPITGSSSV